MIVRFVQMRQSYQTKTVFPSRLNVECFEFLVYCEVKTTTFVNESGEVEQLIFCQNQFKEKPEPVQRKANEEPWIHLKANR